MDNEDHIHPDRKRRKHNNKIFQNANTNNNKKKFKTKTPAASSSLSAQNLKKKIRDESRLLVRPSSKLPATARVEHERALEAYKHELSVIKQNKKKDALRKRYHMVRFFERQKATRKVNQCRKRLSSSPSSPDLLKQLHEAEVDLAYILHFPALEKYVSLYRRDGEGTNSDEKRKNIRRQIEEDMAAGRISLNKPSNGNKRKKGGRRLRVDDDNGVVGSGDGSDDGGKGDRGKRKKDEKEEEENDDDFFEF